MAMIKCPECGKDVLDKAKSCPKCEGSNVSTISRASKAVSLALWRAFAANKVKSTYQCNNCNFKF